MLEFPRDEVYTRIVRAIEIGAELGARDRAASAHLPGVVGDGGVTIAERSPIPVTTGNSFTIAAAIQSLFRGAREMESIRHVDCGRRRRDRLHRLRLRAVDRAARRT